MHGRGECGVDGFHSSCFTLPASRFYTHTHRVEKVIELKNQNNSILKVVARTAVLAHSSSKKMRGGESIKRIKSEQNQGVADWALKPN